MMKCRNRRATRTLCDNAEEQGLTINPHTIKLHFPLPDPVKKKGSDEEIQTEFREAREKVKQRINYVLEQLNQGGKSFIIRPN